MAQIIKIGEHHVQLPTVPRDKSEILFANEKPGDAYWKRLQFPKIWYDYNPLTKAYQQDTVYDENEGHLSSLSYEDSELLQRLLKLENRRRKYGVYMKNENDLVWMAPGYYYNLQWVQMKDLPEKFGNFRECQNEVMTLWHNVKHVWDFTSGLALPKCKKSGITQIMAGDFLNEATLQKGWEMGIMSKEFDHAVSVAMTYFFHGFDNIPFILQPDWKKRNLHEIIFGNPVAKVGTKARAGNNKKDVLNNRVFCSKTKATGFDGPVLKLGWIDEMPKTWEASKVSPDTLHKKVVETVKLQQKKNGALLYSSYMPEIDDRGYKEFREICKRSKLSTLDKVTGKTETSLIVHELTAVESNEMCFDKYGRCDQKKALFLINSENNTKKTISDKQAHRRQYPRDANDMYDSGGKGSAFDNTRLAIQYHEVDAELKSGKRPYREGHLRWKNSLWETGLVENARPKGEFCNVYFDELTEDELAAGQEGSIKFFFDLPDEFKNQVLATNSRDEDDDELTPIDGDYILTGSWDPTDYVLKRDVADGSTNAGHGGYLYNPAMDTRFNKTVSNIPWYEYLFRHENPDDDLEMLIKLIIFTGGHFIIEANKKWVVTSVKKEKLHHFLLLKQKDGSIKPYKKGDENSLVNTTSDMIDAYVRSIKRWHKDMGVDYIKTIKSLKCLQQLMDFEPTDTKRYDLVVSLGYYRIGQDSYSVFHSDKMKNGNDDGGVEAAFAGLLDM